MSDHHSLGLPISSGHATTIGHQEVEVGEGTPATFHAREMCLREGTCVWVNFRPVEVLPMVDMPPAAPLHRLC